MYHEKLDECERMKGQFTFLENSVKNLETELEEKNKKIEA